MKLQRVTLSTSALIEAGVLLAVLIGLNTFACYNPLRFDLTEKKEYTVAAGTKKILSTLVNPVNVRAYISSDLPSQAQPLRRDILDLFEEFETIGNENFKITVVDTSQPDFKPEQELLEIKGIEPLVFETQGAKGERIQKQGYLGLYLTVLDKTHVIPRITSTRNLEYDLMSAIVRISKKDTDLGKISVTQGHGEPSIDEDTGIKPFVQSLRNAKFTVFSTNLDDKTEIPMTVQTLIVAAPTALSEFDTYQLDQFVMRGGNLIVFADPVNMSGEDNILQVTDLNTEPTVREVGAADLLEFYGVTVEPKIIQDLSCENISYQPRGFPFPVAHPYPFWIRVIQTNLSELHPIVNQLESLLIPWASPLSVVEANVNAHPEVTAEVLAKTSPASRAFDLDDEAFRGLQPGEYRDEAELMFEPENIQYPLMVELRGRFTSFFKGKGDPVGERRVDEDRPRLDESEKDGRVIVIGTAKMIQGELYPTFEQTNNALYLNMADYLNLGDDLLGLRSREVFSRPLEKQWIPENNPAERRITEADQSLIRSLNIFLVPVLFALYAAVRFGMKAGRKRKYERAMRAEIARVTGISELERQELVKEAPKAGYALPILNILVLLIVVIGLLNIIFAQVRAEQARAKEKIALQQAKLFPAFNKDLAERIEIWQILGKTVLAKSGEHWRVGHVNYTPDRPEEEKDAALPTDEQMTLANKVKVDAVLEVFTNMPHGELIATNDESAVALYVGAIGYDYRIKDAEGNTIARAIIGKRAEDFSGQFVQIPNDLGVETEILNATRRTTLGLSTTQEGVVIKKVREGSVAFAGGIKVDDVVIKVEETNVVSQNVFEYALRKTRNTKGKDVFAQEGALVTVLRREGTAGEWKEVVLKFLEAGSYGIYKVPGFFDHILKIERVIDWWDPHIFNMTLDQVGSVKISGPGREEILVDRNPQGNLRLVSPAGWVVDGQKLEEWVTFVGDLSIQDWLEEYEQMQTEEIDWTQALTVQVGYPNSPDLSPPLRILLDQEGRRPGEYTARMGEGMVFKISDRDVDRLLLKAGQLDPNAPPEEEKRNILEEAAAEEEAANSAAGAEGEEGPSI